MIKQGQHLKPVNLPVFPPKAAPKPTHIQIWERVVTVWNAMTANDYPETCPLCEGHGVVFYDDESEV